MDKKQAIKVLNQVVEQLHKQGQVTVTPEAFEQVSQAVAKLSEENKK